jgi:hypothetical protein
MSVDLKVLTIDFDLHGEAVLTDAYPSRTLPAGGLKRPGMPISANQREDRITYVDEERCPPVQPPRHWLLRNQSRAGITT